MTTTAQYVIRAVQETLSDETGRRWPASKLVRNLNDMQRAVLMARPDLGAAAATLTLAAGHVQALPTTAMALIEITSLTAGTKDAIRQCRREDLDGVVPAWRNVSQSATIRNFIYDPRAPKRFEVYPPAIVSTQVEAIVCNYPTDVGATTGDGKAYTTVSGNISLPDECATPLIHLTCWRAYMVDAQYAANAPLAKNHFDLAVAVLGEELRSISGMKPTSKDDASA